MRKIVLHIGKACYHMGKALLGLAQRLIAWGSTIPEKHDDDERKENDANASGGVTASKVNKEDKF